MSMLKEFKTFAMRGNVIDMAVGIIIGVAFGKIVTSVVNDVIMPPVGLLLGGVDFSGFAITLKEAGAEPAVLMKYGLFLNTIIDFIIVAFVIFLIIHAMSRMKKRDAVEVPIPTTKECPECMMSVPVKAKRCGHCAVIFQK
jgi:large conductance mechanosensitive channel